MTVSGLVVVIILLVSAISWSCSPTSRLELNRNNEVIQFMAKKYNDQAVYYQSVQPIKSVNEILDLYEGYLKNGAPIVQRRLSESVGLSALDSIRNFNREAIWYQIRWNIEGLDMTTSLEVSESEKKVFFSNVLFNNTFDKAIIYVENRDASSSSGSLVSLKLLSNGDWFRSLSVPIYSGDRFGLTK